MTMNVKLVWTADLSVPISQFIITRSTDKGATFASLVTLTFDTSSTSSSYDPKTKSFFYNDNTSDLGYIYQIVAVGANGNSQPMTTIVPVPPSTCLIVGYMMDAFGQVDQSVQVHVQSMGTRGEHWIKSPTGIVGFNPHSIGITNMTRTVYPDANGIWQVNLVNGVFARIEIPAINFVWMFEVPSGPGPINIRDIPQLRGEALGVFGPMDGDRTRFPES